MVNQFEKDCKNAIEHLHHEFKSVRTGRVNADLVDGIMVEVYGSPTPIVGVATISVQDTKTLLLQPWDKANLKAVEKAIQTSDLGINPMNDGTNIRLVVPDLTEQRRKELVKQVHGIGEKTKVSIRNSRHKSIDEVKGEDFSEDQERDMISSIDEVVKKYNKEVDEAVKHKEKDLMTL